MRARWREQYQRRVDTIDGMSANARRQTVAVNVGGVKIGGGNPVDLRLVQQAVNAMEIPRLAAFEQDFLLAFCALIPCLFLFGVINRLFEAASQGIEPRLGRDGRIHGRGFRKSGNQTQCKEEED